MFRRLCATFLCIVWGTITPAQAASFDAAFQPLAQPHRLPPMVIQKVGGPTLTTHDILGSLAGAERIYLHLWAPSCPLCVKELRALDAAYPALAQRGVLIFALAEDPDGAVNVPFFMRRYGIKNLPLYVDSSRAAWLALNARGIPTTYQVDKTGLVTTVHEGALDWTMEGQ